MSTTLSGAINASVTSLTVASAAGFPTAGTYNILIDSEVLKVTAGQGTTTWTVVRARRGTTGATHADGATVTLYQRTTLRRLMRGQHSPDILAEAIRELQDALDGSYGHVHTGAQDDGPATEGVTTYGTGTTSLTPDNAVSHGTTNNPARTDHVHGLAAAAVGTAAFADAAAEGTGSSVARSDHVHGMPVNPTNELIVNGDCEAAVPTFDGANGTNRVTAVLSTDRAWLGSKSLKLTVTEAVSDDFFTLGSSDLNGLVPGETYTLSAYVYVPSGQSITLANIFLRAYDYVASYTTYDSNTPAAEDAWYRLAVTFTMRASSTQCFARIYVNEGVIGRYIYVDRIRLDAGNPALGAGTPTAEAIGDTGSAGTGAHAAHEDHRHAMPAAGTPVNQAFGDSAAEGDAATLARSNHVHGMPAASAQFTKLGETTADGSSGAVTFSAISGSYRHLLVTVAGRGDTAANTVNVQLQMGNGSADTGNNYNDQVVVNTGAVAPTLAEAQGVAFIRVGALAAGSATAGMAGSCKAQIHDYAGTTFHKTVVAESAYFYSTTTGTGAVAAAGGLWKNTAAVDTVKVYLAAGNFVSGSRITLYGVPA